MALLATLTTSLCHAAVIDPDCTEEIVAHIEKTGNDSLYYNNEWYYENTTLMFYATSVGGCDSITIVNITIVPTPPVEEDVEIAGLIINKYNWMLITNQTIINSLYPSIEPDEYRWYRNGEIMGAPSWRDYNENQALHGTYQLMLRYGKEWIKSTKIDIP